MKETLEFKKLRDEVLCHQFRYYVLAAPTISDREYDLLETKLCRLEHKLKGNPHWSLMGGKPECIISSDNASDYPMRIRQMVTFQKKK